MTKVYDNATDLITFARSSSGTALRRVGYGDELVTNGTFDTDTDWTKGTGWTISGGVASKDNTATSTDYLEQTLSLVDGAVYEVSFTISNITSGSNMGVSSSGAFGDVSSSERFLFNNGTRTFTAVYNASTGSSLRFVASSTSTTMDIDNISIREVIFDRATDPLVLYNHLDDTPRIEYGSDGSLKGLLIEEARTNLVTTSAAISGGNWFDNGGVLTENAVTAPDGTQTGSAYDTDGSYRILRNLVSVVAGTTYTWSFYAKNVDATAVSYRVYDNTQAADIVSATSYFSQINTSDWTRVSVSFTAPTGCSQAAVYLTSGNNGGTVAFWGAQVEAGSFPTSYIPTSGSTVTRSPDLASIPVSAFGYNQAAGTVVVECQHFTPETTNPAAAVALDDGSQNNRLWYYQNKGQWIGSNGGVTQFSIDGADPAENTELKAGMVYSKDDFALYVDGVSSGSDTSGSVAEGVTTLHVGKAGGVTTPLNGHIKSIQYYPRRLTDAQLQELTA